MDINNVEQIVVYIFAAFILINIVLKVSKPIVNGKKRNAAEEEPVDLSKLENMRGGIETTDYVQNNGKIIGEYLSAVNSSFSVRGFVNWAKTLLLQAEKGSPFIAKDVVMPMDIKDIFAAYLNLYERKDGMDYLWLYFTAVDREDANEEDAVRYFAVFKRKSHFSNRTDGEVQGNSCPYCSGEIFFGDKDVVVCPYCGNTVSLKENDWILCDIKPVGGNIENIGVIIRN